MARPIKDTPVLRGAEAVRFLKQINESKGQPVTNEEKDRLKKNFEFFESRSKF
jgi:hypothetical protein